MGKENVVTQDLDPARFFRFHTDRLCYCENIPWLYAIMIIDELMEKKQKNKQRKNHLLFVLIHPISSKLVKSEVIEWKSKFVPKTTKETHEYRFHEQERIFKIPEKGNERFDWTCTYCDSEFSVKVDSRITTIKKRIIPVVINLLIAAWLVSLLLKMENPGGIVAGCILVIGISYAMMRYFFSADFRYKITWVKKSFLREGIEYSNRSSHKDRAITGTRSWLEKWGKIKLDLKE